MQNQPNPALADIFGRDSADSNVFVADGYGLTIRVHLGHLVIDDGIGVNRRQRRLSRAQRRVSRLVILGHTGMITLDAIRWCADVGVAIQQIDTDGRVLAVSAPRWHDDGRLRRAQALASSNIACDAVARYLLGVKLSGQAAVADELLHEPPVAHRIREYAEDLDATDIAGCRNIESKAANLYFNVWYPSVIVNFAQRDADKVPQHWRGFATRSTPLHVGKTARKAADPINALLNYCYAIGEAEAVTACSALGLDPGLGVIHTDKPHRDSLALDLLETIRPTIDRYVITSLRSRVMRAGDFYETRDGGCRILAPLTHELAGNAPAWHAALAPHAERLTHLLAGSSAAVISRRTPLTGANARAVQRPGANPRRQAQPREVAVPARCVDCGCELIEKRRKRCGDCNADHVVQRGHTQIDRARSRRAELRSQGQDPCAAPEVVERKAATLRRNRAALLDWQRANPGVKPDPKVFARTIQPGLLGLPISAMQEATGLSAGACSRIRSGKLVPHARHWPKLTALGAGDSDR